MILELETSQIPLCFFHQLYKINFPWGTQTVHFHNNPLLLCINGLSLDSESTNLSFNCDKTFDDVDPCSSSLG